MTDQFNYEPPFLAVIAEPELGTPNKYHGAVIVWRVGAEGLVRGLLLCQHIESRQMFWVLRGQLKHYVASRDDIIDRIEIFRQLGSKI